MGARRGVRLVFGYQMRMNRRVGPIWGRADRRGVGVFQLPAAADLMVVVLLWGLVLVVSHRVSFLSSDGVNRDGSAGGFHALTVDSPVGPSGLDLSFGLIAE